MADSQWSFHKTGTMGMLQLRWLRGDVPKAPRTRCQRHRGNGEWITDVQCSPPKVTSQFVTAHNWRTK